MKKKKSKVRRIALDIIMVCLAGIVVFSGYRVYKIMHDYKVNRDIYSRIAETAMPEGFNGEIDFDALRKINPDIVGWLYYESTNINYPIVQGKDNSYYLNHLFNGKQQRYGTLFIDAQNSPGFSDENTIIYGHHLKNGKMFGTLMYYGDGNKYYRKHPVFKLYTPDHIYLVELFANAYVDGAKGIPMTFSTKEEYAAWIDRMYRLSTFDSDVVMTTEDRMVTLYTCSYDYDTQRQLLVGKLVPLT